MKLNSYTILESCKRAVLIILLALGCPCLSIAAGGVEAEVCHTAIATLEPDGQVLWTPVECGDGEPMANFESQDGTFQSLTLECGVYEGTLYCGRAAIEVLVE